MYTYMLELPCRDYRHKKSIARLLDPYSYAGTKRTYIDQNKDFKQTWLEIIIFQCRKRAS